MPKSFINILSAIIIVGTLIGFVYAQKSYIEKSSIQTFEKYQQTLDVRYLTTLLQFHQSQLNILYIQLKFDPNNQQIKEQIQYHKKEYSLIIQQLKGLK